MLLLAMTLLNQHEEKGTPEERVNENKAGQRCAAASSNHISFQKMCCFL